MLIRISSDRSHGFRDLVLLLLSLLFSFLPPFTASLIDAVAGSSTGTSVPWMWALLRLPRFRGASHADDNDDRFRPRQVGFPGSRRRRWRPGDCSQAVEASLCTDFLPEAIAMSGRYRSLRVGSPLVSRAPSAGSHGAVDAAGLCEALRQAAEERCD